MAINATVFKADIQITDMDRHYYQDHALTIARHPSENDERMMLRILAFALNASESLTFTKGISTEDEPDIWQKNLSGEIEVWIELGQPDEKRIRRACGRSRNVIIYTYNNRSAAVWRQKMQGKLQRFSNLKVFNIDDALVSSLAGFSRRTMQLQVMIQDGIALVSDGEQSLELSPTLTN